jgi:hypothetical protein
MLQGIQKYAKAAACRGEAYSAESLLMALVFQQQKMISQLIKNLSRDDRQKDNSNQNKANSLNEGL